MVLMKVYSCSDMIGYIAQESLNIRTHGDITEEMCLAWDFYLITLCLI
jgi:hypothetical protein